jgi:hypothetical protein
MADSLKIANTRILRSPAAGPEPCNTLVFLRCLVPGLDVPVMNDEHVRSKIRFQTEFRVDGYVQSQFDWYKENTLVSATASLRFLNTTTDLSFLMAVDTVAPELQQLDGSLAFEVGLAAWFQDDAWFAGGEELVLTASLTAYVLCFEPRSQRPASGLQRTPWASAVREGPGLADMRRKRVKPAGAGALSREPIPCRGRISGER